jgi:TPR repeat protein
MNSLIKVEKGGITFFLLVRSKLVTLLHFPSSLSFSLTHKERLHAMGCGLKGNLVRLLSMGVGFHNGPNKIITSIARRVAAGLAVAIRNNAVKEANELCASGQIAIAVVRLQRAIDFGHLSSMARMAYLLLHGRKGMPCDEKRAFRMAQEGAQLGSIECVGILAICYWFGYGCEANWKLSLQFANLSAEADVGYGKYVLGRLSMWKWDSNVKDVNRALLFFEEAANWGVDLANLELGRLFLQGTDVPKDVDKGLRWLHLAAGQKNPLVLTEIGTGYRICNDKANATKWYRCAQEEGCKIAESTL